MYTTHDKLQENRSKVSSELDRLIAAAVVDRSFRQLLLSDPALAISRGSHGECFQLTPAELNLVLSTRATSLKGFAMVLANNTGCVLEQGGKSFQTTNVLLAFESPFAIKAPLFEPAAE